MAPYDFKPLEDYFRRLYRPIPDYSIADTFMAIFGYTRVNKERED